MILTAMKGLEPKTVHNMYKLFRAIVNWHYRQEDQQPRKWSPDLPPLRDEEQRWFTPDEAALIVANAEGRNKMLFHLAASSGMRAGELFGLKVEDIDFNRQVIHVVRSTWMGREVPTKTRKGYREVFVDKNTVEALHAYLDGRTNGLVFPSSNGTLLRDRDIVFDVLYPICDKLEIERGGMHAFRHGRVSLMRVSGAPEDLVKRQIGHSSLKTTSGYTHFSEDYQRDLANKLLGLSLQNWTHSKRM